MMSTSKSIAYVSPDDAWRAVERQQGTLIDVREPGEFRSLRAPASVNLPLSSFENRINEMPPGPLFILCAAGPRAVAAAKILEENGRSGVVVEGGMMEWSRRKLPTESDGGRVWPMERQVRFGAGVLVLTGLALDWFVAPWFFLLSTFVAGGLIFSGITGMCGMAWILGRCPWNRRGA